MLNDSVILACMRIRIQNLLQNTKCSIHAVLAASIGFQMHVRSTNDAH